YEMNVETLRRLSKVRRACDVPFRIVSDYRSPGRNKSAGGATRSAHMDSPCHAVDLRVHGSGERFRIVEHAIAAGFRRIGIYQPTSWQARMLGKNAGSVHLDDSPTHPQGVMWVSS